MVDQTIRHSTVHNIIKTNTSPISFSLCSKKYGTFSCRVFQKVSIRSSIEEIFKYEKLKFL